MSNGWMDGWMKEFSSERGHLDIWLRWVMGWVGEGFRWVMGWMGVWFRWVMGWVGEWFDVLGVV